MDLPQIGYNNSCMDAIRYGVQDFALLNRYLFHTIEKSLDGLE
ncbi:MAG: hypothetical protein V7K25_27515 [Nostoc sp.]